MTATGTGIDGRGGPLLALVFVSTVLISGHMTMLSVTAPVISADLGASPTATTWMVLGYLLVTATTTVAWGQVSDLWDARRLFGVGLVGMAAMSLLLVVADGPWFLVAVRTVQGLFSAIIIATAATLLVRSFPGRRLAGAMGVYLGGYAAAQVVAPPVGGFVADSFGWRWMFVGAGVLSVAACAVAPRVLRGVPATPRTKGGLDLPGNLLLVVGVGALLLGATRAQEAGWTSGPVLVLLGVALVAAPTFVLVEARSRHPVVDIDLLRDPAFALAVVAGGLVAVPRVVPTVVLAVLFQGRHGMSATRVSGIVLLLAAGVLLGSVVAGRLTTRYDVAGVCRASVLVTVAGVAGLAVGLVLLDVGSRPGLLVTSASLAVTGLASGIYSTANAAAILGRTGSSGAGSANGVRTTAQSVAIAVGTAVLLALLGSGLSTTEARAFFAGDHAALGAGALRTVDRNLVVVLLAVLAVTLAATLLTRLVPRAEAVDGPGSEGLAKPESEGILCSNHYSKEAKPLQPGSPPRGSAPGVRALTRQRSLDESDDRRGDHLPVRHHL